MATFTVSYELHPPAEADNRAQLSPTAIHTFHLKRVADCKDQKEYYEQLSSTLLAAKDRVGMELTAWKEAVGNAEQPKVPSRKERDDESEEGLSQEEDA